MYTNAPTLRIIHVRGTDREMGRQHVEQIGSSVNEGMVTFYHRFWQHLMATQPKKRAVRLLSYGIKAFIDPFLTSRLIRSVPEFALERIRGVAEASHLSEKDLYLTLILPDLFPLLQAYLVRLSPRKFILPSVPRFGCSSFLSRGNGFLHGRNLDFPGVNYWDRFPVIQVTHPKGGLKYIGFSSAGVPFGGITGINEAQVGVSLHQHYGSRTLLKGTLPFLVAEEILSSARTLEEAERIVRAHDMATAWTFVLYDGKIKSGATIERHASACGAVRLSENTPILTHSNFFQTPECRASEYATTARMNWDNYYRKVRLFELVQNAGPDLQPAQAVTFLGDHYDPFWKEEKTINRTVSQAYNIQSLLVDPVNMKAWIAVGDFPVQLRSYQKVDLGALFAEKPGETGNEFPGFRFKDEKKQAAKETYVESFVTALDGKEEQALKTLMRSLALDFSSEAAQVAAILSMKAGDDFKGIELLERAKGEIEKKVKQKASPQFPPEYFEICIHLARNYDLVGKRPEANAIYRLVAQHGDLEDEHLRAIAQRAPFFRREQLEANVMPFSTYVPFQ